MDIVKKDKSLVFIFKYKFTYWYSYIDDNDGNSPPVFLLDFLYFNILISLIILMVALQTFRPLDFLVFLLYCCLLLF